MKIWGLSLFEMVLMCLLSVVYICLMGLLLSVGADDLRMVNVFSIDESDIVAHVWNLYVTNFDTVPSFKYGGLFYLVPVGMMHVWALFFDMSEKVAIIAVRLYCGLAGVGCLWMVYALGRFVFSGWVGILGALMMAINPTFFRWTVESHPDVPQLFFLLLGLFSICRYTQFPSPKLIALASLGAGLAFATKYAGIFLMPVLGLAIYISVYSGSLIAPFGLRTFWGHLGIAVGVFVVVFVLTTPFVVTHFSDFVTSLQAEKKTMAFGHHLRATSGAWQWGQMLVFQVGLIPLGGALVGGVVWGGWFRAPLKLEHKLLVLWCVGFLFYLMLESSLKRPRHLLPILPVVWLFVGAAYVFLWNLLHGWIKSIKGMVWVLCVVVLVLHSSQGILLANLFFDKLERESTRVEITAGRWLADKYPPDSRILFDAYSYVPDTFPHVFRSVGLDYMEVNHFEPDILIVRKAIVSDFANLEDAKSARMGEMAFKDRHYFYAYLQEGKLPSYRVVRDFNGVAVYERTIPKMRDGDDIKTLWRRLLSDYIQYRRYGVVEALWTMGYLHLQNDLPDMAIQDFNRAQRAQNFTKRIYSHGVFLLKHGSLPEAQHALQAALAAAKEEPVAFQAGMREDLAYRFFEVGLYQEMLGTAQEALALEPNLPAAAFEVACAHLTLGNNTQGVAKFEQAVGQFGAHPKGKTLLSLLLARQIAPEIVTQLQTRYYGQ